MPELDFSSQPTTMTSQNPTNVPDTEMGIKTTELNSESMQPMEIAMSYSGIMKQGVLQFLGLDPMPTIPFEEIKKPIPEIISFFTSLRFYVPHIPPLSNPGWAVTYVLNVKNPETRFETLELIFNDIIAGITVALLLIPQGLSYATLALLPAVNGLYASILPAAVYILFGSSMQLVVGPVAISSLLTGALISKYRIDYAKNPQDAIDLGCQAAMALGIILVIMSVLNIGTLVRFISYPVMSGFTTAAACLIGLSQLKNAFGFSCPVPQQGDTNTEWNYQVMQWFKDNWNGRYPANIAKDGGALFRNPIATNIFVGLYIPLLFIQRLKGIIKSTPERKKMIWFKIWTLFANLSSFIGMIITAKVAYDIISANYSKGKITDYYVSKLKVVGEITPGADIGRIPNFKYSWSTVFVDVLPLTFISFMESYSIAVKLATNSKQLHFLSCNQELWAIGMANIIGSCASAYPVAGSYSRSSLNGTIGAKTPISGCFTVLTILLCLGVFTKALYFIPNAALAAVIWVALYNIIAFTEWWEAYISSSKDFFVMIITFFITFIFDTSIGLAVGLAVSLFVFLFENLLSERNLPMSRIMEKGKQKIELVRLNNNLNFLTIPRIKDFIAIGILMRKDPPHAIVVDFVDVKHIDLTCLKAFEEIQAQCHEMNILFVTTNVIPEVASDLCKFHIIGDCMEEDLDNGEAISNGHTANNAKYDDYEAEEYTGSDDEETHSGHKHVTYDVLKRGFTELQDNPLKTVKILQYHPSIRDLGNDYVI